MVITNILVTHGANNFKGTYTYNGKEDIWTNNKKKSFFFNKKLGCWTFGAYPKSSRYRSTEKTQISTEFPNNNNKGTWVKRVDKNKDLKKLDSTEFNFKYVSQNVTTTTTIKKNKQKIYFGKIKNNVIRILMNTSENLGGFQFDISGVEIEKVFGGQSKKYGFSVSNNKQRVIGFSMEGKSIPAGKFILIGVKYSGSGKVCLGNVVLSDVDGKSLEYTVDECQLVDNIPEETTTTTTTISPRPEVIWELVRDPNNNDRKSYVILGNGEENDVDQAFYALHTTKMSGVMLGSFAQLGTPPHAEDALSKKVVYSENNGLVWNLAGSGDPLIQVNGEWVQDVPEYVTDFMCGLGNNSGFIFAAAKNGIFWSTNEGLNWKRFKFTVTVNDHNRDRVIGEKTSMKSLGMSSDGRYLLVSRRDIPHIYKFDLQATGISNIHEGSRVFVAGRGSISQFMTNNLSGITYFLCDASNAGVGPNQRYGGIYTNSDNNMNNWSKLVLADNSPLEISHAKRMIVTEDANCDIYVGLYASVGKYTTANMEWDPDYITNNFSRQAYIVGFISNIISPPYICNSHYPYWIKDEIDDPENNDPERLQPNLPEPHRQPNQIVFGKDGRIYLGLGTTGNVLWRSVNPMENEYLPEFIQILRNN